MVMLCSNDSKRIQGEVVSRSSLAHLLDTMHAGSDVELNDDDEVWNEMELTKDDRWDVEIMDDKIWDEAMLGEYLY
jgi:hypothetical protein